MGKMRTVAIAASMQALFRLSLVVGMSGLLAWSPAFFPAGYNSAYADDDDDDDASAGASAGGSSVTTRSTGSGLFNRLFGKAPRKKASGQRKSARPKAIPLEQHAGSEIVTIGLSAGETDTLETRGYVFADRVTIGAVGAEMARLVVPRGISVEAALAEVRAVNAAAVADFNHYYRPQEDASCQGEACASWALLQWPLTATAGTACGEGVRLGMVDTAVNVGHGSLDGSRIEIIDTSLPEKADAGAAHGTAVASLLIGNRKSRAPGLLPLAALIAADPFERVGSDDRSDTFAVVAAIDKVSSRDVHALNLSFAGPDNDLLEKIVTVISEGGIPLIAAAGNAGAGSPPLFPAGYPAAIAVTAIDRNKNVYRRAVRGAHIDFAAPGVNVWAAASVSGGKPKSGTSFATPFVTAAAALIKFDRPQASTEDIVTTLSASSLDLGEPDKDNIFGHGLIQAGALCAAEPATALPREG